MFYAVAAIVMAMGAMIVGLGATISGGKYGQKLQGGVLAAAGAGLAAAAAWAMMSGPSSQENSTSTNTKTTGSETDAAGKTTTTTTSDSNSGKMFGMDPYVLLGGGAALVGLAGTMMVPANKYPASDFNGKPPPDIHLWGYQEMPSVKALKTMVA